MLTTKNAGGLLGAASETGGKVKITMLRGAFIAGENHPAGETLEVDDRIARQLIGSNKAVAAKDAPKKATKKK
jgi:hypothetical protein